MIGKGVFMNLKAIILDIDGTLYTSEKKISPRTLKALLKAQDQGIKLILASGRPARGMRDVAHELKMDENDGLLVSYNGAAVYDCQTDELLFNQAMSVEEVKAVLNHLENFDVKPMIAKDDTMYVNNVFDNHISYNGRDINIIEYESRGGKYLLCEKEHLGEFADFELNKILIAADPTYLKNNYEAIRKPFEGKLSSMFTAAFYYEFTANGIDKGNALHQVLTPMGIKQEDCIAFGDGQNDMSIIKFAGHGVAMDNAVDELKAAAQEVTASNDEDGIAIVIERYL